MKNLKSQLDILTGEQTSCIDIVRTLVFTSLRKNPLKCPRAEMVTALRSCNFDVHTYLAHGNSEKEKCVDIALASEMLYYATLPNAYDIAVLVSGDFDFMPALLKVRQQGKRVAVCATRKSCSRYI